MKTIKIIEMFDSRLCVSPSAGDRLKDKIESLLKESTSVTLDFEGVRVVTTTFLNHAIGYLVEPHGKDYISNNIKLLNSSHRIDDLYELVLVNAEDHYSNKKSLADCMAEDIDDDK